MDVIFERVAGLDVHKKKVTACRLVATGRGRTVEVKEFETNTAALLDLSDWLAEVGITHVGMESTGEYWRPVHNILEGNFEVWLLNAAHIKNVPGKKTDVKDAEWIAQLVRHGLVRPSFIPPREQRDLRDLTRHRTNFVQQRATLVNRVQKVLEGTNIKLASVATDIMGVSGRAMLDQIVAGEDDTAVLAELARGRMRNKHEELIKALEGRVRPHHRFVLAELLSQIDSLDTTITRFNAEIHAVCKPDEELVELLDTIPGVGREIAELLLAEVGNDMSRFPTAAHLAWWIRIDHGWTLTWQQRECRQTALRQDA